MIIGPIQVISCPNCKELVKYYSLISGNTFGSVLWSDGKRESPMMLNTPSVVQCHNCLNIYWLQDATKIGEYEPFDNKESPLYYQQEYRKLKWDQVGYVQEPFESGYYRAIAKKLFKDTEQEKRLRILTWWKRNDDYRDSKQYSRKRRVDISPECEDNMNKLLTLVDLENENEQLMYAELLRELRRFDDAIKLFSSIKNPMFNSIITTQLGLCRNKNNKVKVLMQ